MTAIPWTIPTYAEWVDFTRSGKAKRRTLVLACPHTRVSVVLDKDPPPAALSLVVAKLRAAFKAQAGCDCTLPDEGEVVGEPAGA